VLFRSDVWFKVGGYDELMPFMGAEDWDFWLRAAARGHRFYYYQDIGYEYRYLSTSMLRSINSKQFLILDNYFNKKHSSLLGLKYLNEYINLTLFSSYRRKLKLFVLIFLPFLLNIFIRLGIIKSKDIF
jgi:GT2 family glycosyltransferase